MKVGERIRALRERQRLTTVQLAARAGIDQSYLSKVERGASGYSGVVLEKVVAGLGTNMASFFGAANVEEVRIQDSAKIPILDYVQAGEPAEVSSRRDADEVLGYVAVDATETEAQDMFALVVRGRSMTPDFLEGDCVILKRSLEPQPGDFVVAVTGGGEATFKRYKVLKTDDDGRVVFALVPSNDDFPTMRSDEHPLQVRATMVEHRRYRKR